MSIRRAVPADIDGITDTILAGFPLDPMWDWRYPFRHEFADDHRKYTRLLVEKLLDPANQEDWAVLVAEGPVGGNEAAEEAKKGEGEEASGGDRDEKMKTEIAAVGVWDVSYLNKRKHGPGYEGQNPFKAMRAYVTLRRDIHPRRAAVFVEATSASAQRWADAYGAEKIHLGMLATRLAHMRRGHGARIVRWGLDVLERDGGGLLAATVHGSAMGAPLYRRLGFVDQGDCVIRVPGEEESILLKVMVLEKGK